MKVGWELPSDKVNPGIAESSTLTFAIPYHRMRTLWKNRLKYIVYLEKRHHSHMMSHIIPLWFISESLSVGWWFNRQFHWAQEINRCQVRLNKAVWYAVAKARGLICGQGLHKADCEREMGVDPIPFRHLGRAVTLGRNPKVLPVGSRRTQAYP